MTTTFSGTKILKFPKPRVLDPATIVGFEGGSSTNNNVNTPAFNEITLGVGSAGNPDAAKHNSMYELKI